MDEYDEEEEEDDDDDGDDDDDLPVKGTSNAPHLAATFSSQSLSPATRLLLCTSTLGAQHGKKQVLGEFFWFSRV